MEYAFDNALPAQGERLRTLEALLDQGTIRCLDARGLQPSWHCLEVGAGGGSIARWLADRTASVLATDLDVTHLRPLAASNLEVREHDLLRDDLPADAFDLIHVGSSSRGSRPRGRADPAARGAAAGWLARGRGAGLQRRGCRSAHGRATRRSRYSQRSASAPRRRC